jgi:hypothetical protein
MKPELDDMLDALDDRVYVVVTHIKETEQYDVITERLNKEEAMSAWRAHPSLFNGQVYIAHHLKVREICDEAYAGY